MTRKHRKITDVNPTVVDEVILRQVVAASLTGASDAEIGRTTGLSRHTLRAMQQSDKFKDLVRETGEEQLAAVVGTLKQRITKMGEKAAKVYEKVMDDYLEGKGGARDAVVVAQSVTRSLGVDKGDDKPSDSNINIIFPGEEPKTVHVQSEVEDV